MAVAALVGAVSLILAAALFKVAAVRTVVLDGLGVRVGSGLPVGAGVLVMEVKRDNVDLTSVKVDLTSDIDHKAVDGLPAKE